MSAPSAKRSILHTVSRSRRRVLVAAMYVLLCVFSLGLALNTDSWWTLIVTILVEILYLIVFSRVITPINKEIASRKESDLDERQLAVRDRAHYHAYQLLGSFLVLIVVLPMAAATFGGASFPMSFTHSHFLGAALFSIHLTVSLPASVVAWMEPDPRPDL